jgi:hypothetical protein
LQLIENINFNSGDSGGNGLSLLKEEYDPEALKQCKCGCRWKLNKNNSFMNSLLNTIYFFY